MWEENDEIGNFEADSPCGAISAISPAPQDDQSARPARPHQISNNKKIDEEDA